MIRRLAVALPFLLAFALCLLGIGSRQFWRDEMATWWVATMPWDAFLRLLSEVDAVMGPYYILQRAVVAIAGDGPTAMRLPSALMIATSGALTSAVAARLLELTGSPRERADASLAGLMAGLCFALIPSVSYYGQEARVYGCAVAAVLTSTLLLLHALETPERTTRWVGYGLGIVFISMMHVVALSVLMAHAVLVLWLPRAAGRPQLLGATQKRWVLCVTASLLLLLPFFWFCASQAGQVAWNQPRWRHLWNLPDALFHQKEVGRLVFLAAFAACLPLFRGARLARLMLAVWAFGPIIVLFATRKQLHLFLHRYLLFTLPALCVLGVLFAFDVSALCSRALTSLTPTLGRARGDSMAPARTVSLPRWLMPALLCALVAGLGLPAQSRLRQVVSWNRADYRGASQLVLRQQQPGDAIVFGADPWTPVSRMSFTYFARDAAQAPRDLFSAYDASHPEQFYPEGCPDTQACLPQDIRRLWLVTTARETSLWTGLSFDRTPVVQSQFRVARTWRVKDLTVALLTRK